MNSSARIYLDNAATSWPKPDAVYAAVDRYQRQCGAAVGRGATRAAADVQAIVTRCRQRAARLLGAESPERVLFTFNGTDGLNLAIHGLLQPGDHVVTTVLEHNSVLRPLRAQHERGGVDVDYVGTTAAGTVDLDSLRAAVTAETTLVAVTHASNVTGAIQPIEEVGNIAHQYGALVLVDAAQTAGHLLINLATLPVDILVCSGHKGLLGPLGTGLLYVRPGLEERIFPLRYGGTGSQSETDEQPMSLPDRYESGNHNAPGLVGLEAALAWVETQTLARLREHEQQLTGQLRAGLQAIAGVTVYGPASVASCVGVVSVNVDGFDPREAAAILDEHFQIETRAGFHCAPLIHDVLGTSARGGTLRLSVGPFTTPRDLDAALDALRQIAASANTG
jgi:cysteine desulfurase family protein